MAEAARLYYELHGPADAPPLILSSGLGGSADYWKPNLAAFAEHFRVLVYDHRGTGRSDRALPDVVTVDDMSDDALSLIAANGWLATQCHFVGHAIGGLVGLEIALRHGLNRLVIVNGWTEVDQHTERCFDARLLLLRHGGPDAFVRAQPIFLYPADWIATHEDRLAAETTAQLAHFPDASTVEKRIAAARRFTLWLDMPNGDILALAAADDMLVPSRCSTQLVENLCGLPRLEVMPWGGHACNVTDPDTFNRIVLDFLRS